ncbi:hypothetical protein C8F04DRAFT_1106543, partial [Mycena alexandri]
TKLTVRAVDATGEVVKLSNQLSSSSLARFVSAFPNLTHLDVCLRGRTVSNYRKSLIRLTHLQSLRVQEDRKTLAGRWNPVTAIFPAAEYGNELLRLLPSLSQLTTVEFSVLGDNVKEEGSGRCGCGGDCEQMDSPPEMTVAYRFSVVRTSSEVSVVLRDTRVCDARYHY